MSEVFMYTERYVQEEDLERLRIVSCGDTNSILIEVEEWDEPQKCWLKHGNQVSLPMNAAPLLAKQLLAVYEEAKHGE